LEVIPNYLTIDQMEEALTAFLDNGSSQSEPKQATFKSSTQSKPMPKAESSLLDGIDGMLDDDMEAQLGNIGFGKK
jgi:hypothetical protein